MKTCIALFRGINVGGRNSLPMKELAALLEGLGARKVRTYIQSGNAAFDYAGGDFARLRGRLASAVMGRRGFAPEVLILTLADLEKAMEGNPFPEAETEPATLHLGFLASTPTAPDLKKFEALKAPGERYRLTRRVFYLPAPDGCGKSTWAAGAEKAIGVPMTVRNWRTVCAIGAMARERA
jgi:uncharacterized protein (DUF1697 family)